MAAAGTKRVRTNDPISPTVVPGVGAGDGYASSGSDGSVEHGYVHLVICSHAEMFTDQTHHVDHRYVPTSVLHALLPDGYAVEYESGVCIDDLGMMRSYVEKNAVGLSSDQYDMLMNDDGFRARQAAFLEDPDDEGALERECGSVAGDMGWFEMFTQLVLGKCDAAYVDEQPYDQTFVLLCRARDLEM